MHDVVAQKGPSLFKKVVSVVFCALVAITLTYYIYFFLFLSSAAKRDFTVELVFFGGDTILVAITFIFIVSFIITYFLYKYLTKKKVGGVIFYSIGALSILYSLFALFIFPNIGGGETFSAHLVTNPTPSIGDMLTYQIVPSSGFYTKDVNFSLELTEPDKSVILANGYTSPNGGGYSATTFFADIADPNCHVLFTLTYCTPTTVNGEFYLPGETEGEGGSVIYAPFQFDEEGTYMLSATNNSVPSVEINPTPSTSTLPVVLESNAIITDIPGVTLSQKNESFDNAGFLNFEAYYNSTINETYTVSRESMSELDAQQTINICGNQSIITSTNGCQQTFYTFRDVATTTTVDGSVVFVAHSWVPAFTAAEVASNPDNQYFDEVYWVSGDALLKIDYNNNSGHYTYKNVYDSPVFQAYIKQYPVTPTPI